MRRSTMDPVRGIALAGGDAAALWFCRPDPARLLPLIRRPAATLARLGGDAVVALVTTSLLWVAAVWVGLALLTVFGARLPGLSGRVCRAVADVAVPSAVQRLLLGAVGVGVGVGVFAGPAMSAATASPVTHRPSPMSCVAAASGHARLEIAAVGEELPAPPWPGTPEHTRHHPSSAHDGPADRARVERGDSLWLIATRRLGPEATAARTADYWPRVYAANRAVIGPDPDLISPGQVLRLPEPERGS